MGTVEKVWSALGGRKFLVFISATALVATKIISQEIWFYTAAVYCAANVAQKVLFEKALVAVSGRE